LSASERLDGSVRTMFNLFFFIFMGGVYTPLDVGEIPAFETYSECASIGQVVIDSVPLPEGKIIWICEEIIE